MIFIRQPWVFDFSFETVNSLMHQCQQTRTVSLSFVAIPVGEFFRRKVDAVTLTGSSSRSIRSNLYFDLFPLFRILLDPCFTLHELEKFK